MSRPRNKIRFFYRLPAAVLLAAIILSSGHNAAAEGSGQSHAGRNIRIMVLSKSLRELKEGRPQPLCLDFPAGTCAETGRGTFPVTGLAVRFMNGRFTINCDGNELGSGRTIITGEGPDPVFSYSSKNGTRRYPLPLEIISSGDCVQFIVTENIMQYAVDSASAELGVYDETKAEALYALAHAVLARSLCAAEGTRHAGAHFCDLTCCQGYRGRSRFTFDDPVTIDAACGGRIFFGSSGGGVILTARVFSTDLNIEERPIPDVIYSENSSLSRDLYPSWRAAISIDELNSILYAAINKRITQIEYSVQRETMTLAAYEGPCRIAPETFRLAINRVKGWSFIKSNNYEVRLENGIFVFRGSGLGHCAGMSIEGAVQLASRGYSRYEILEHYFPWIRYGSGDKTGVSQYMKFAAFDLKSGIMGNSKLPGIFLKRRIPMGSVYKLVTVLYLAAERRDLFYNHRFRCTADRSDKNLPQNCWEPGGHGDMDLRSAIYSSCNLYFASLYTAIDMKKYSAWVKNFSGETGIDIDLPAVNTSGEFAALLAGLNYSLTVSIRGLVRLAMLVSPAEPSDIMIAAFRRKLRPDEFSIIRDALCSTMTIGTGSHIGSSGARLEEYKRFSAWGKTGTVISGTNSHCGYGIFIGGCGGYGIVAIFRKGTGAIAADYSGHILLSTVKNQGYNKNVLTSD